MKTLIQDFPKHLLDALEIGNNARLSPPQTEVRNVLVAGMGGSGIGGAMVSQLVADNATVPIKVSNDYSIPCFVDEYSLVIVCSYSGNTEETLEAMNAAQANGAQITCVTSGGKVLEIASQENFNHIIIPGGMPPRAAFGYSFTQLFYLLNHYGIISSYFKENINMAAQLLKTEQEEIKVTAKDLAAQLHDTIPIIYSDDRYEAVATRFRQQLNENSKMLCWHHRFPEMNHNELVGWRIINADVSVILLQDRDDNVRTQKRMAICKEIFLKYTSKVIQIESKGNSFIEKALYLVHLGDWTSFYLAEKNGVDPTEVSVIDQLKAELSKFREK